MAGAIVIGVVSAAGISVALILLVKEVIYGGAYCHALCSRQPECICQAQVAYSVGIEAVLLLPAVAHVLLAHILCLQRHVEPSPVVGNAVAHDYLWREREACLAVCYIPTCVCVIVVQHLGKLLYAVAAEGGIGIPTESARE